MGKMPFVIYVIPDAIYNLCVPFTLIKRPAHEMGLHCRSTSPQKAKLCLANALEHSGTDLWICNNQGSEMPKASHQPSPLPFNSTLLNRKPNKDVTDTQRERQGAFLAVTIAGSPRSLPPHPKTPQPPGKMERLQQKGPNSLSHVSKF